MQTDSLSSRRVPETFKRFTSNPRGHLVAMLERPSRCGYPSDVICAILQYKYANDQTPPNQSGLPVCRWCTDRSSGIHIGGNLQNRISSGTKLCLPVRVGDSLAATIVIVYSPE